MISAKVSSRLVLVAGILLILSSLAHYFAGYPEINKMLADENAGPQTAETLKVIWIFSSITMFLSGLWCVFLHYDLKDDGRRVWWQCLAVGTGMLLFSIVAQFFGFPNYHLMLFGVIGLLILVPILVRGRASRRK
jgi:hypothetical protein